MDRSGSSSYGPSWRDIGEGLENFERKWGGAWSLRVTPTYRREKPGELSVLCKRTAAGRQPGTEVEAYVSGRYPTHQYVTLPALMLSLLFELDRKLTAVAEVAERQTTF